MGKNAIIDRADISSCVHIDKKGKDILIIDEGPTQELDYTILTSEANYRINFTQLWKKFVISLHYNRNNSLLFIYATKIYQFKAKDSKIKDYILCLGNISKYFTINNMKKKIKRKWFFFCWF